jgi:protein-tyrosine phosphatase
MSVKPTYTSLSSPIEVDILTSEGLMQPGQLAMTMAPGKQDEEDHIIWKRDLQADLDRLREHYGVDRLVCLLEKEELEQLKIPDLLAEANTRGMMTEHLPLPDDGLPASMEKFSVLVDTVVNAIATGETVLIHCKGGQGRTGMLAAACLVRLGYTPEAAIATIRQVRAGALSAAIKREYVHQFHTARNSQP